MAYVSDNLFFIHIPKTGGTSIKFHLLNNKLSGGKLLKPTHYTYDWFIKTDPKFKKKISFTIIRNPFDRFVSMFRFFTKEDRIKKQFGTNYNHILNKINSFEKFIENFDDVVWGDFDDYSIWKNQYIWANNIDYIFKIEEPWKIEKFLLNFNIKGKLPIKNARDKPSWKDNYYKKLYSIETKKIIEERFLQDLNKYNYEF